MRASPRRMVGKDPHRPQGKTKDAENMGPITQAGGAPYESPSQKEVAEKNRWNREMRGGQSRFSAHESVGGSRPKVESRVKEAIDKREAREGPTD